MVCQEMRNWLGVGDSWCWDDALHGVCRSQDMLYSVYAVLGECCAWCILYLALVLATGLDRHFGSGYRSEPNRSQIGGPGRH